MSFISRTSDTFHEFSGWLKEQASLNMAVMYLTEETSQLPTGWLKAEALQNMRDMSSTADT